MQGRGKAVTAPPQWVWDGLAHYTPEAAELACQATDLATAERYFEV